MRVTLVHAEIQSAVVAMLAKRGVNIEGQDIAVAFSMGRKNTGLSATVDIVDPSVIQLPDAVVDEDDEHAPVATSSAPSTAKAEAKETKEVKNTFVAKADEAGTVTVVNNEPKEDPKPVKAEKDPPFDVDESATSTASSDASVASEATSAPAEEAPKKTTQSLFAQ